MPLAKSKLPPQLLVCGLRAAEECVSLGTQNTRDETFSSLPFIHFTRVIGASFPRSFGGSYINFGKGCTSEMLRATKAGDYLSCSSSPTCFGRKASRAL
jgi:hypothetical protein